MGLLKEANKSSRLILMANPLFKLTNISLILFATTAINFILAYISWQRRKTKGGTYFALGIMAVTFWTLSAALDYAAVPLSLKIFFATAEAWGYCIALTLFTLFVLSFTGNDGWLEQSWVRLLFFFIPVSNILLISTNPFHGWVWKGYVQSSNNVLVFEHGPGFLWLQVTSYLLAATIIINLLLSSSKGSNISRRQARLLLFAILFPLAANLIYIFEITGLEGVDWTSITFSITGFLILRALYGQRLLDLIPVARDTLISGLADGMIVLDTQNRIIDINLSATNMMSSSSEMLLGKDIRKIVPPTLFFLEQPLDLEIKNELEIEGNEKRCFEFIISPLREGNRGIIGRLIIFRDITARKENELRLLQLTQELQETQAQIVEQQRTLAKLEERQRLGRDMHDSVNQSIHSLMLFSETLNVLLEKKQIDSALDIAKRIQESGRQALKEIRLLLFETQSLLAEDIKDLMVALEERLNMVERRVGIKAELNYQGAAVVDYPSEWNENLYWMAIEALNNSLKHSQSRKIQINISYMDKYLNLDIRDEGNGFDLKRIQTGGLGMRSMRERAELLGGQLNITSSPGNGTWVSFHVETEAADE